MGRLDRRYANRLARRTIALFRCIRRIASGDSEPCRPSQAGPSLPELEPQAVVGQDGPNSSRPGRALIRLDAGLDIVLTQNSLIDGARRCQRFFELLQGDGDSCASFSLVGEIRFGDGYTPLKMDFQQVAIPDIKDTIGRIHVDDRFIACGVVDPGEGMWRYGLACCGHMQPRKRSESCKIDPARPGCEIEGGVGRCRIGTGREAMNNVSINVAAAHQLIAAMSANTGIVTSVDQANSFLECVTLGAMAHLAPSVLSSDAFVSIGRMCGRQAGIVRRETRGWVVCMIGVGMSDRGQFCGRTLSGEGREAVDRRLTQVMGLHGKMGVVQCVDQRTGESGEVAISLNRHRIGSKPGELMFRGQVTSSLFVAGSSQ